jgi:hypothetical protein
MKIFMVIIYFPLFVVFFPWIVAYKLAIKNTRIDYNLSYPMTIIVIGYVAQMVYFATIFYVFLH